MSHLLDRRQGHSFDEVIHRVATDRADGSLMRSKLCQPFLLTNELRLQPLFQGFHRHLRDPTFDEAEVELFALNGSADGGDAMRHFLAGGAGVLRCFKLRQQTRHGLLLLGQFGRGPFDLLLLLLKLRRFQLNGSVPGAAFTLKRRQPSLQCGQFGGDRLGPGPKRRALPLQLFDTCHQQRGRSDRSEGRQWFLVRFRRDLDWFRGFRLEREGGDEVRLGRFGQSRGGWLDRDGQGAARDTQSGQHDQNDQDADHVGQNVQERIGTKLGLRGGRTSAHFSAPEKDFFGTSRTVYSTVENRPHSRNPFCNRS